MQLTNVASRLCAGLLLASVAVVPDAQAGPFNDLFVFGDSYSDTGAFVPLTNGSTAAGYLAQRLGVTLTTSKNPTPGTKGVNFAESGARIGLSGANTQPRSLTTQVNEFKNYLTSGSLSFNPATSLFFLSGGLNDHTSPIPEVIADYTAQVNLLYDLGARHIELALIPSLVPAFADSASRLNPVFTSLVPELQMLHPDAKITLSGWGLAYDDILKNPGKYGITNTTDPCFDLSTGKQTCTTPETYFYYYIVHPSDAAHRIVGDFLFNEALATVPEPASLGLLAAGFGLLILVRRRKGRA